MSRAQVVILYAKEHEAPKAGLRRGAGQQEKGNLQSGAAQATVQENFKRRGRPILRLYERMQMNKRKWGNEKIFNSCRPYRSYERGKQREQKQNDTAAPHERNGFRESDRRRSQARGKLDRQLSA